MVTQIPIEQITLEHIRQVCADGDSEGPELELKRDLPAKNDRRDPWHDGCKAIGEYARNEIAKEIVAFANSYGGTVLLGIEETKDKPNRAKAIASIPEVHELARRLRQSIYDVVDPPLPVLEAAGVVTETDGNSGVVVLRVPTSRRRPHRSNVNKEVYIRRADESAAIDMRHIQELTIQAMAEARRVEDDIRDGRELFRNALETWLGYDQLHEPNDNGVVIRTVPKAGSAIQFLGIPTAPLDLGRIAGQSELYPRFPSLKATIGTNEYNPGWPFSLHDGDWKPMLRAIFAEQSDYPPYRRYELRSDGRCELRFFQKANGDERGFFIEWLIAAFAGMLFWIERIRRFAGTPAVEFALACQMIIEREPAVLGLYGSRHFREGRGAKFPVGAVHFPLYSVANSDEFEMLLQQFDEDIWNHAGRDIQISPPMFDLSSFRNGLSV